MKTVVLLMLGVMLFAGTVCAAPIPPKISHHVPGDLAKDRLQDFADMLGPPDRVVLEQPNQPRTQLSQAQVKTVVPLLRELILDDALYVEDASPERAKVSETFTLEQGDLPVLTVSIDRDQPVLNIYRVPGGRTMSVNYLPVLPKVIRLLQATDPADHSLKTFQPLPPLVVTAKGIPISALKSIATIKPGMTRADLQYFFTTEGGLSTTYWNHYVYRDYALASSGNRDGMVAINGQLIKVNIDFAPHDADIVWFKGRGFWLHQSDYLKRSGSMDMGERSDDVILRMTAPYLENSVDN